MKAVSLPYSTSTANPEKAMKRIRDTLRKFGVSSISFIEHYEQKTVEVAFKYKQYPVAIPLDYGKLAERFMERDPYNRSRKRIKKDEWENRWKETAYNASFSILEDILKSLTTVVELGVFSFEEIFFCSFVGPDGKRLGERLTAELPRMVGRGTEQDK